MNNHQRRDYQAPPNFDVDESYWAALLKDDDDRVSAAAVDMLERPTAAVRLNSGISPTTPVSSRTGVDHTASWADLRSIYERDETIELMVIGCNRGGLLVEYDHLRGFVPASQLVSFPNSPNLNIRQKALTDRIGQTIVLRIIELSEEQNRLILSERAAQARPGERAGLLDRLKTGDQVEGQVTNLCDFGAFVDLGGLEGLIHISELSWGRVSHPNDILKRGQRVQAFVLDVNKPAGRIALSIKRLTPDPWQTVHQRYAIGQYVSARITSVVDFGAFARIEDGLEGLIHVSELAEGQFLHPRNVVMEGQVVQARILSIDGRARRLGLSLRALNADR